MPRRGHPRSAAVIVVVGVAAVPGPPADPVVEAAAPEVEATAGLVLVPRQRVAAHYRGLLQVAAAMEAGGVVRAAAAVVDRGLGVRAQRAAARDRAVRRGRGEDLLRGHA